MGYSNMYEKRHNPNPKVPPLHGVALLSTLQHSRFLALLEGSDASDDQTSSTLVFLPIRTSEFETTASIQEHS